jgi:protocatechuate 3,4-dioxygenase beta subunit
MNVPHLLSSRRGFLKTGLALSAAFWTTPGLFAEELARTPSLTEGPFYPDKLPLDMDNDLVIVGNSTTPAIGEITHLGGRVLSAAGEPVRDVTVEIWQVDGKGIYLHSRDNGNGRNRDTNFQGFGKFTTGSTGEYKFRTIKPIPYPGRTPHIHVKVKKGNRELLTTQIFVAGHAQNARDGIYLGAGGLIERELVTADFAPVKDSKIGELAAKFDIVLGRTPEMR